MVDALSIAALLGLCVPVVIEVRQRGVRPISDAISRALIGSGAVFVLLICSAALFGFVSRIVFIGTILLIAAAWVVVRKPFTAGGKAVGRSRREVLSSLFAVGFVSFAALFVLVQPHYAYDGYVIDSVGVRQVNNEKITTPYFSDEWASAAFVKNALATKSLPTGNPFIETSAYTSYLTPYFMVLAAFFATFSLDPVFDFAAAPLVIGMMLTLSAYMYARSFGASRVASAGAALTVPFITNSANLAGIWYAIPAHAGLLILLHTLSLDDDSHVWRLIGYIFAVVMYPPIIIFVIAAVLVSEKKKYVLITGGLLSSVGVLVVTVAALAPNVSFGAAITRALDLVVRPLGLDFAGDIALYPPYYVLPAVSVIGFILAIPYIIQRNRKALAILGVGLFGWIAYSLIAVTVIIDVQRVVFITAVFVCITASLGYDSIIAGIKNRLQFDTRIIAWIVVFLVFVQFAPTYSADQTWRKFVLPTPNRGEGTFVIPAPPASSYLGRDDLALLSRYDVVASSSPRRFISTPWKGLVLGTATRHIPLYTKASIVGVSYMKNVDVVSADCEELDMLRVKYKIRFAYFPKLKSCPFVVPVATSTEGFVLYELKKPTTTQPLL